jgi:rRNA-processing protein FCF1
MSNTSREEFIRDYSKAILSSCAALFVGSGLSRPAGYSDWKDILREAAADIKLDIERETDLISLAQYYVNTKSRTKIDKTISEFFSKKHSPTENRILLASLPIKSYWTTNYDQLLERTFDSLNKTYAVLTDDISLKKFIDRNGVVIHKLHGDVETPSEAVITRQDYEDFARKHEILLANLKGGLCSKSFLFLGYSLTDTDIRHILSQIRLYFQNKYPQTH